MKKAVTILGSLASIIALGFFIYFQFIFIPIVELDVKTIEVQELTKSPSEKDLEVRFSYRDSTIKSLFRHKYVITNTGSKTLIGKGNKKDLITDGLSLGFVSPKKTLLEIRIADSNFPIELIMNESDMFLDFKQWRAGESLELVFYSEDSINWNGMNERDIVNGKVTQTEYKPLSDNRPRKLINRFSSKTQNFFWWSAIITYCIMAIAVVVTTLKSIRSQDLETVGVKVFTIILIILISSFFYIPILWLV